MSSIGLVLAWCPGKKPPDRCDPCASEADLGNVCIQGTTYINYQGLTNTPDAVLATGGGIGTVPPDWSTQGIQTVVYTWTITGLDVDHKPVSVSFSAVSAGVYGSPGTGGNPPFPWAPLPKTSLGITVDWNDPHLTRGPVISTAPGGPFGVTGAEAIVGAC